MRSINRSLLFAVFSCMAFGPVTFAEEWTRFRGEHGSGVSNTVVPTTWSNEQNLRWKTNLPGAGASSPVVIGDRIFLTAYSGYGDSVEDPGSREDLRLHVVCLSLHSGEVLWDKEFEPAPEEQPIGKRVAEHGYASPTPCVDEANVYAYFGPSGVIALTHDGEFLWRRNVGTKTVGFGAAASPIEFEGLVIMNASIEGGAVYGLDKATGEVAWRTDNIVKAWTTPTVVKLEDGSYELILNQQGKILGLDPRTGEKLWSFDAIEDYVVPAIVADGSTLYCSGGRSNKTFVVKAGGRGDVSDSHLVWEVSRGANVTTPVLHSGHLYWSHDKAIALCLRASDGEEMFRERLPTRSRVYASIVADREKLFLTTRDEGVVVIAAEPTYRELAINRVGEEGEIFNATPAIVNGQLLLRSNQSIYCIAGDE
ncbi:outer membrane protein assembly factor BamB family protein [Aporhodopirellula aestuarii]|uniref:PQQ-binding-like beta-propeller repeat protein n=1 Tax=Aporhodopirellula aestuarii TaxID=2950107 RepID=A0ABT0UBQ7_9BACT|nr:PQQ-binding-like beta-propeller repeat protein [Aporhodopirellula aestuarii]MCM2374252.1 PQQ-binding-like beta-propeller repeat protein [Aporhodopirellula aestuarii]